MFNCNYNRLTSLEGGPKSVGGIFYCSNNQLASFEGAPQSVVDFYCGGNPIWSIWNLFGDYSYMDTFNDYDPIRDNKFIILDRLNSFLSDIGKPTVTEVDGWKCI